MDNVRKADTKVTYTMEISYDSRSAEHVAAYHTFERDLDLFLEKERQMFSDTITQRVSFP